MTRIAAISGSSRSQSFNTRLVSYAARIAVDFGAEVTTIDLRDYPMPIYDGDLEAGEGLPESTLRLREVLQTHDALLISCPEYNGSITPLLKNTIDWVSRPVPGVKQPSPFSGKIAALMSASPGALGGMRGLVHVHAILDGMGVLVVPGRVSLGRAHEAFGEDGALRDEATDRRLRGLVQRLVDTTGRLVGG